MNAQAFLAYLRSLDVEIQAVGDRLRCSAPKGVLTPTLQAELAHRKAELLAILHGNGGAMPALPQAQPLQAAAPRTDVQPESARPDLKPPVSRPALQLTPIDRSARYPLSYLDTLVGRYTERTRGSKEWIRACRPFFADNDAAFGFQLDLKEMCYPLVVTRALGSKIWDIDGNEYVDLCMGFGVNLFGHSPPFVMEALAEQLQHGMPLGPQWHQVDQVARLICELTGVERVTFVNTGTEAVMAALRLARTVTSRPKIVMFDGAYHGTFDGVLMAKHPTGEGVASALPWPAGVPRRMAEDVLVLNYGDPASLQVIKNHAHELAAVLVEPVQSRHPDLQPRSFLHELRALTAEVGVALIFDEVITGFRIHPGGAQAWFGVRADLATYGKVLGGGLPIGVVAGKAEFMDPVDGGQWRYGDDSYPKSRTTFVVGTFSKHPLCMAAALALLKELKRQSPVLQERLNQRTADLVGSLNAYFSEVNVPIHVAHFGSLFRFESPKDLDLFFYHLIERGVYVSVVRNFFLSTAHSDQDVAYVVEAIQDSVEQMRAGQIWPEASTTEKQAPRTTARPTTRTIPLTESQQQFWVLTQISEGVSRSANESFVLQLRGSLDVLATRTALQRIVDRHEALRTTIDGGGEFGRIWPSLVVDVPVHDCSHLDGQERQDQVSRWMQEQSEQLFDLATGPLLRCSILKLGAQDHFLALTIHHSVIDGWSLGVIIQEFAALYTAECDGKPLRLAQPLQFEEYVRWEKARRQSPARAASEAYWLEQFSDGVPVLELPTDRSRPAVQTCKGGLERIRLDPPLLIALKRLSGQQGSTLFMTLLSAYTVLLHRLTSQDDIVVGILSAERSLAGAENLIGYCVNVLPIRSRIVGNPTFLEHLLNIRQVLLDAYEHSDYPIGTLIRKLNPVRDASRPALVSVDFNLDRPGRIPKIGDLTVDVVPNPTSYTHVDLSLSSIEIEGELRIDLRYSSDLFEPETIQRWMGYVHILLQSIVEDPQQRIYDLPLLTDAERQKLLVTWNETGREFPQDNYVAELFERQVERTPQAVATIFNEEHLTYQALNARANGWAEFLAERQVGPNIIVAILAERGNDFLTAILAVFKAGGAYLPMDTRHPPQRLGQILEQSRASLVIVADGMLPRISQALDGISSTSKPQIVTVGTLRGCASRPDNLPGRCTPRDLAYVIFTSGSTGVPKGAMLEQVGMVNHLYAKIDDLKLAGADVIAQNASQCFDISVWQFISALLVGGQVCILGDEVAYEPVRLLEQIEQRRITVLEVVPSILRMMAEEINRQGSARVGLSVLRWLIPTGEALPPQLCRRWMNLYPHVPLVNAYGPTECSDDVTHCFIHQPPAPDVVNMPIGRPIINTKLYILHENMGVMPTGVAGELYVGGIGVGRGYLGRPDLTAERFIPNPFSAMPGMRLYRTGDLARYLPDGNIEFLGRIDFQIKVRGFRIELGEIESVLSEQPGVEQAVVVVREDVSGEKHLVAYVVPTRGAPPTVQELRIGLKAKLPDYMVPSAFMLLETLPLTSSGKVDRKVLPAPEQIRPELESEFLAPRTPTEQAVVEIWTQVLGVEKIGVYDNFFELGGHSLLATQVISWLRSTLEVELSVTDFFEAPTVAGLAEALVQRQLEQADQALLSQLLAEAEQMSPDELKTALDPTLAKMIEGSYG